MRIAIVARRDLLAVESPLPATQDGKYVFRLRLNDAYSGRAVSTIESIMPSDQFWWAISDDGSTIANVTYDNDGPRVECHETQSGQLLRNLVGWHGPICLSADGRRLAAFRAEDKVRESKWAMGIWDLSTGRELALCTETFNSLNAAWPIAFSSDSTQLLDSYGRVWDVASNEIRLRMPDSEWPNTVFSGDGSHLIHLGWKEKGNWLTFWDVKSGEEETSRRSLLDRDGTRNWRKLSSATPDASILVAHGMQWVPAARWRAVLNRFAGVHLPYMSNHVPACALLEAATGREVALGEVSDLFCSVDGRFAITLGTDGRYQVWEFPQRKPLRWLLPSAAIWCAIIGLLVWSRLRRTASSPTVAAVTPESTTS
jgi:WD40 repeat protein